MGAQVTVFMTPIASRFPFAVVWMLVATLAISLAYWTWRLVPLSDATVSRQPVAQIPAGILLTQNWFSSSAGEQSVSSNRYTLRWLYPGRPGVCILGLSGLQDRAFRVGEEIEPGVKLKAVAVDHVLLESAGGVERIDLPEHQPTTLSNSVPPPPPNLRIAPDADRSDT